MAAMTRVWTLATETHIDCAQTDRRTDRLFYAFTVSLFVTLVHNFELSRTTGVQLAVSIQNQVR
jgi:hypothetical protein